MDHTKSTTFSKQTIVLSSQIFEMMYFIYEGARLSKKKDILYMNGEKDKIDFILKHRGRNINIDVEKIGDKSYTTLKENEIQRGYNEKFIKEYNKKDLFKHKLKPLNIISRKLISYDGISELKKITKEFDKLVPFLVQIDKTYNYKDFKEYLEKKSQYNSKKIDNIMEANMRRLIIPTIDKKSLDKFYIKNKENIDKKIGNEYATYFASKKIYELSDKLRVIGLKNLEKIGGYILKPYILNWIKTKELKEILNLEKTNYYDIINNTFKLYSKLNKEIDKKKIKKISFDEFNDKLKKEGVNLEDTLFNKKLTKWFLGLENREIDIKKELNKKELSFFYETDSDNLKKMMRDIYPSWKPTYDAKYENRVYLITI